MRVGMGGFLRGLWGVSAMKGMGRQGRLRRKGLAKLTAGGTKGALTGPSHLPHMQQRDALSSATFWTLGRVYAKFIPVG
ncbi:MAG: hypothetical protein EA339_07215 [Rhodobacteraceae bacterium]|nr:MAG: hypothetical protein EA339_07215 [Paracoccaceae bacterium]